MINYKDLKDWQDSARSGLRNEIDRLEEKEGRIRDLLRSMDVVEELLAENDDLKESLERKQREVDDLAEQLEQKQVATPRRPGCTSAASWRSRATPWRSPKTGS